MQFLICFFVVFGLATASQPQPGPPTIVTQTSDIHPDGAYSYSYETSNGIAASESGVGGQNGAGVYSYYAPDGTPFKVTYTADENGFHPTGDHLPTPPPIPAAILKSLEWIRDHPSKEEQLRRQSR